jgi:hypothetical protein
MTFLLTRLAGLLLVRLLAQPSHSFKMCRSLTVSQIVGITDLSQFLILHPLLAFTLDDIFDAWKVRLSFAINTDEDAVVTRKHARKLDRYRAVHQIVSVGANDVILSTGTVLLMDAEMKSEMILTMKTFEVAVIQLR